MFTLISFDFFFVAFIVGFLMLTVADELQLIFTCVISLLFGVHVGSVLLM